MAKLSTTSVFGDLLVDGMIHGNVTGNLTGNASTATSATTATKAGKWSTARTLTIGNKGQSVDGSGNVSWTLDDIGAVAKYTASANIGAAGKYFTIFELADQYYGEKNNYLLSINRTYNSPNNESYIFLIVGAYGEVNITQLASRVNIQLLEEVRVVINTTNADSTKISKIEVKLKDNPSYTNTWYATLTPLSYNARVPVCHNFVASDNTGTTVATLAPSTTGMKLSEGGFNGNATTATTATSAGKWSTARTLTIGSTGKTVDGSGNVSWSLSEIGAQSTKRSINFISDHASNWTSSSAMSGKTYAGGWHGNTSTAEGYLSFGNSGDQILHMFIDGDYYARENKKVFHEGNLQPTVAKLATARTLTIGNTGKSFDGSANVSWSLSEIGALPAAGGNVTGNIKVTNDSYLEWNRNTDYARISFKNTGDSDSDSYMYFLAGDNGNEYFKFSSLSGSTTTDLLTIKTDHLRFKGNNVYHTGNKPTLSELGAAAASHGTHVTYATTTPKANGTAAIGSSAEVARADHIHPLQTSVSGNAGTATKLATARTLTIGNKGKTFDGSGNQSWSLAEIGAAAEGHTHSSVASANVLNQNTKMDYGWSGLNYFNINGTAGNAAKVNDTPTTAWWHIIRCNHANSSGYYTDIAVPFNATSMYYKRITSGAVQNNGWVKMLDALNFNEYAAAKSHGTHVTYATATPKAHGTAAVGTSSKVAREDHVHPLQTSAATWTTARTLTIGNKGQSVNGSGNVSWSLADIGAVETVAWDTSIKCATWSRLFQYSAASAVIGGAFLVNIQATRGNVVYNPTVLVNFGHSSTCNIVQINNISYSNIKIRGVVNSNGAGYLEIYDNVNSATNSTTQGVTVSVTKLTKGLSVTKYTAFTDGTTIPTNYASKGEITTVSGCYYTGKAATSGSADTATSATKLATARNIKIGNATKSFNGTANIEFSLAEIGIGSSISAVASNLSGVTINGYDSMMTTINSNLGNL